MASILGRIAARPTPRTVMLTTRDKMSAPIVERVIAAAEEHGLTPAAMTRVLLADALDRLDAEVATLAAEAGRPI